MSRVSDPASTKDPILRNARARNERVMDKPETLKAKTALGVSSLDSDTVSLSREAKEKGAEQGEAGWVAPIDQESGSEAQASQPSDKPQVVKVDASRLLEILKQKLQANGIPRDEDGLPRIAIHHRSRFFPAPEVEKPTSPEPTTAKPQEVDHEPGV